MWFFGYANAHTEQVPGMLPFASRHIEGILSCYLISVLDGKQFWFFKIFPSEVKIWILKCISWSISRSDKFLIERFRFPYDQQLFIVILIVILYSQDICRNLLAHKNIIHENIFFPPTNRRIIYYHNFLEMIYGKWLK